MGFDEILWSKSNPEGVRESKTRAVTKFFFNLFIVLKKFANKLISGF